MYEIFEMKIQTTIFLISKKCDKIFILSKTPEIMRWQFQWRKYVISESLSLEMMDFIYISKSIVV